MNVYIPELGYVDTFVRVSNHPSTEDPNELVMEKSEQIRTKNFRHEDLVGLHILLTSEESKMVRF